MTQVSTLRPGLLIGLHTRVAGNVSYNKVDIEPEHLTPEGFKKAVWETEKRVQDPAEHDEATKIRSKCRSLIVGVCSKSNFGLLCPEEKAGTLWDRLLNPLAILVIAGVGFELLRRQA